MLGSPVMLRMLAGVYAELTARQAFDYEDVAEFFVQLAPSMAGPVTAASIWVEHVPDNVFTVGSL